MIKDYHWSLRLIYDEKRSNLKKHIEWLEYIVSPRFVEDANASYRANVTMQQITAAIRQVVEEEIYSIGSSTGRIKRSFTAEPTDEGVAAYSDPSVAPSKGPFKSGSPEEYSYAAFFERPAEFNSFIPPRDDPSNETRYRPFMTPMVQAVKVVSTQRALKSVLSNIRAHQPRKGN
jgi:hypothetical protein